MRTGGRSSRVRTMWSTGSPLGHRPNARPAFSDFSATTSTTALPRWFVSRGIVRFCVTDLSYLS